MDPTASTGEDKYLVTIGYYYNDNCTDLMAYTHQGGGNDWCVSYLETSDWYEYTGSSTSVTWHGYYDSVKCSGTETETTLTIGDCVAYGDKDYYLSLESINVNYDSTREADNAQNIQNSLLYIILIILVNLIVF